MPLLLKLERMFMVSLVGSQTVSSSLGTEDKKPLLFYSLKGVLCTEDSTEIAKGVTLEFTLIKLAKWHSQRYTRITSLHQKPFE